MPKNRYVIFLCKNGQLEMPVKLQDLPASLDAVATIQAHSKASHIGIVDTFKDTICFTRGSNNSKAQKLTEKQWPGYRKIGFEQMDKDWKG